MKKLILLTLSLLLITTTLFWTACSKTEDEGWTDEDKASYEEVISLQKEVSNNLDEWFLSMDSLDAINMAYQSFTDAPNVSEAFVNSQGIAVQYANGIRGGLFLNPRDEDLKKSSEPLLNSLRANNSGNLKTTVNNKSMILLNPHYYERSYLTDQIYDISLSNLNRIGIDLADFYKNEEATVDRFTKLSDYGIIQIYSHGWAYPRETNIQKIYLLTGETANDNTTHKYWSDLTSGNITIAMVNNLANKYYVSKEFIANHNDFSNDTIMFFGGFCYSFLGDWPDLVDSFAGGAYLGFDWSVLTFFNANMSVNSMALMSDTSKTSPMNLEAWMNDPGVEKSFWHSLDNRTVSIHYAGDGNLTLWGDVSVNLIALSDDGTPVSKPGEAGVAYPFKCEVVSNITELEYVWDIGDGSSLVTASNSVNITWSEDGQYVLKVDVKDKSNGNIIGTANLNVTIDAFDVIEFATSCSSASSFFNAEILYSPSDIQYYTFFSTTNIEWNGLSFNGTLQTDTLWSSITYTISGTLSEDGQKISYESSTLSKQLNSNQEVISTQYYTISVQDYPLYDIIEDDFYHFGYAWYGQDYQELVEVQQYVTNFEGYTIDEEDVTHTFTGVEWNSVYRLCISLWKNNND